MTVTRAPGQNGRLTLIVKPVSTSCNLRCKYCFYNGQQDIFTLMDDFTLERVIAQGLSAAPQHVMFIWHGGEPLLAGIDFYRKALALQEKLRLPNQRVRNLVQTNGTLPDGNWVSFLKDARFKVGISLDGPQKLHDYARVDEYGKGTFTQVMQAIELMRSKKKGFGIIAVVNSNNVKYPDEMYRFFVENGLSFSPNACVAADSDSKEVTALAVGRIEYAQFLKRIFDLWAKDDNPALRIRPLVNIIQGLLGVQQHLCQYTGRCQDFLTVDADGSVYPCDKFTTGQYRFGNLTESSFGAIADSASYQLFYGQRETARAICASCRWYPMCNAGCMREWDITDTGPNPHNAYCAARKMIFSHVEKWLYQIGAIAEK